MPKKRRTRIARCHFRKFDIPNERSHQKIISLPMRTVKIEDLPDIIPFSFSEFFRLLLAMRTRAHVVQNAHATRKMNSSRRTFVAYLSRIFCLSSWTVSRTGTRNLSGARFSGVSRQTKRAQGQTKSRTVARLPLANPEYRRVGLSGRSQL